MEDYQTVSMKLWYRKGGRQSEVPHYSVWASVHQRDLSRTTPIFLCYFPENYPKADWKTRLLKYADLAQCSLSLKCSIHEYKQVVTVIT